MDYRSFSVDRVEDGIAVLINSADGTDRLEVSAGIFPMQLSAGMTVRIYDDGRAEEDREASDKRKKRIDSLMKDMFE